MSKFTRPCDLIFPQIYSTFRAPNKTNDAIIEYQIRDLPEELFERSLEMLATDFVTEETICVASDLASNPLALDEVCFIWHEAMKDRFSLGCFANDGSDEIAGIAVMKVLTKDKDPIDDLAPNEKVTKIILKILDYTKKKYNIFDKYDIDKYLTDYAIFTRKEFRNRNIATELIKSRMQMMKLLNISVTSSPYTVIGSQKAAAKAGHYIAFEFPYEELQQQFPTLDFSKRNVDVYKIMDFKI